MSVRVMSFGGGVQSTAMLVLAARGEIDFRTALFCNVGADSENPGTLDYIERWSLPYAEAHGIELQELRRIRRDGQEETVLGRLTKADRSIAIPVFMNSGAPGTRQCTIDFKIRVVQKEIKRRGATKDDPAVVALGISVDEFRRMKTSRDAIQINAYPLIDLRMTRNDCLSLIRDAGLPEPPKSSCYFCPFHSRAAWKTQSREEPELFAKSVEIERMINRRREKLGRDHVWLSATRKPLDEAFPATGQVGMFDDDEATCDVAGYCHS